ncbi:4Fe-4S binding protein [Xylanibacter muris]|uniref:4Fe-4S binding protein n=1 Tax=Xylanibacter muris TaxID=2736290 RepID=A0ABX2ASJ8_9BACT|nr:4Fe-4S binding protein [Xylanibacter muris]NPD92921.1 4Fe-4S binding protein [Xylanibacter muris]
MKRKIKIVCFSPTGTSAKVAEAVALGISDSDGSNIEVLDATHHQIPFITFGKDDVVVIAAPVYGGRLPKIAAARMDMLRADGTPAVLIAVYGNRAFEKSLSDMENFAVSHGFVPVAVAAFVGEHSYSTETTPIAVGRPDREDIDIAYKFGVAAGEKVGRGDFTAVDASALHDRPADAASLANFMVFVQEYRQQQTEKPRKLIPVTDVASCVHCGKCVALCPVEAIEVGVEENTDAVRCIKCCACVKGCPQGARVLQSPFAPVLAENFSVRKQPVFLL